MYEVYVINSKNTYGTLEVEAISAEEAVKHVYRILDADGFIVFTSDDDSASMYLKNQIVTIRAAKK